VTSGLGAVAAGVASWVYAAGDRDDHGFNFDFFNPRFPHEATRVMYWVWVALVVVFAVIVVGLALTRGKSNGDRNSTR